jgi:hypothetical protein
MVNFVNYTPGDTMIFEDCDVSGVPSSGKRGVIIAIREVHPPIAKVTDDLKRGAVERPNNHFNISINENRNQWTFFQESMNK